MQLNNLRKNFRLMNLFSFAFLFILGLAVNGQTPEPNQSGEAINSESKAKRSETLPEPFFTNYKEVRIGITADEVKEKLGKPKLEDKDGFFYNISKEEQVQIGLDAEKKVGVIVLMYSDKNGIAPKYEDIFGSGVEIVKQPNGNIYNLIRYPNQGFWIAYSRIEGDEPSVTITIQKI